jgi:glycyl-tRNA synthetase beta chain
MITTAARAVADDAKDDEETLVDAITTFMADRVRRWLTDVISVSGDTADAVMAADWSNLPAAVVRARALEEVRGSENFRTLALAFKRVRNITDGQPDRGVDPQLFESAEESELYAATEEFARQLEGLLPRKKVEEAFLAMEPIAEILERFFIEVLVMCEDEHIRDNRIALLKHLGRQFMNLADLSKLQIEGGE